jgi:glycine/D-amino acid oxidase-like deaminating enzyme
MNKKVAVVGGGVIGLSSALRAIQEFPGLDITVISETFSPDTTGDGASGVRSYIKKFIE